MVFDVAFIVFPQALPRGGVEEEGERLKRNGDADVQISVDHVVVEDTGALFPTEGAPEQTGGVDAGPKDERWGNETCWREESILDSGLTGCRRGLFRPWHPGLCFCLQQDCWETRRPLGSIMHWVQTM